METDGAGREYKAYPNLARARWFFPANDTTVRRAGIRELFHPSSLKGHLLQKLILSGGLPGTKVLLQDAAIGQLESELAWALSETEIRTAFYTGVAGAYRKITAQVMSPGGRTLAFAKIATSPATRELIERERRVLLRLSKIENLQDRVPEVLHAFDWEDSRVLLITSGPDQPGPRRLSSAHSDLCREVFLPFAERITFGDGAMMAKMSDTLRRIGPQLPEPLSICLNRALARVGGELGPVQLPVSLCHRDFAPWNTRIGFRGLFAFDWDGAQDDTTPLYDLFHFQAIQAALFDRRTPTPDRSFLRASLHELWPDGQPYLSLLYLAYLLDISLFYGEARVLAPDAGEDRVWNWLCGQIQAFLSHGSPL
jgi:hypothetical protein